MQGYELMVISLVVGIALVIAGNIIGHYQNKDQASSK